MNLSPALSRIAPSQTTAMTDRATQLREEGRDIISLSVGEPDFATPPHVLDTAHAALDRGDTKYTPVGGTSRLKQAAALHFARDLGIDVPPSQITVSAGALSITVKLAPKMEDQELLLVIIPTKPLRS